MQRVWQITLVVWIFALINLYIYNAFRTKQELVNVTLSVLVGTILFSCVIVPLIYIVSQLQKRKKGAMNTCLLAFVTLVIISGIGYVALEESKSDVDEPLLVPMLIYFVGLGWIISALSILLIQPKTQFKPTR
jgi:Na+-transporting NADH:ubiquinone oxidoreductase subunit NqrE